MVEISGNTYPHREALKRLGCRYQASRKVWMAPPGVALQAQALVGTSKAGRSGRAPRTCKLCGCRINYGVYCGKCEYA